MWMVLAWLRRAATHTRDAVSDFIESHAEWRRKKRAVDLEFDARFGVDTGGVTKLSELSIQSERVKHAVNHIAMDPGEMQAALDSLRIDHARFSFVDLGAGKGRAVLMASLLPFRRIVGVEFAPELARVAQDNLRRFSRHPEQRCRDIEVLCQDAASYALPSGPVVVFMYNPFGPEVMREVVAGVLESLRREPRELYVLYANPFHAELWAGAGFAELARGPMFVLFGVPAALAMPA